MWKFNLLIFIMQKHALCELGTKLCIARYEVILQEQECQHAMLAAWPQR
jgi:hypothetical protein